MSNTYDVIVIGAGIAGAFVASEPTGLSYNGTLRGV